MSLSEGSSVSSSPESPALAQALAFFGDVADHAAGSLGQGARVASLAAALARIADLSAQESDALFYAARLRNIGALAAASGHDVPARGARLCERIAALPAGTADIVRWRAECWDGTGFPDRLRWGSVPQASQLLHLAAAYAGASDPEEALAAISACSGRDFSPEYVRTFVMWFHSFGGEIEPIEPPRVDEAQTPPDAAFAMLAECIDAHVGVPGRSGRVAELALAAGRACGFDEPLLHDLRRAALLYGAGELRAREAETQQFDALSRLGIEARNANAAAAAALMEPYPSLAGAAAIVRARAQWHGAGVPAAAQALAVAIAYEAMEQSYRTRITEDRMLPIARLETAAGTQFDPQLVRALASATKAATT